MHSVLPYKPACTQLPAESVANQFVAPIVDPELVTSYALATQLRGHLFGVVIFYCLKYSSLYTLFGWMTNTEYFSPFFSFWLVRRCGDH